jgi:hypothetical protein
MEDTQLLPRDRHEQHWWHDDPLWTAHSSAKAEAGQAQSDTGEAVGLRDIVDEVSIVGERRSRTCRFSSRASRGVFPIFWYTTSDQSNRRSTSKPTVSQFPLAPGFCVTGHKAQGQTLSKLAIRFRASGTGPRRRGCMSKSRRSARSTASSSSVTSRRTM